MNPAVIYDCKQCPAGWQFTNKESCTVCVTGKYQEQSSAGVSCKFCAAGKRFYTKTTVCVGCGNGKYQEQNTAASVTCKHCMVGLYYDMDTKKVCKDCDSGKYQDQNNAVSATCKYCVAGKKYALDVALACIGCDAGMYQSQNNAVSATLLPPLNITLAPPGDI